MIAAEKLKGLEALLRDMAPPFTQDEARVFQRRTIALSQTLANLDDIIVVGIAGGTGVGKSTLINALAGDAITAASVRRPTSRHIMAYHHRDLACGARFSVDQADLEACTHDSDALRHVIILDLPDSDSIDHRHHAMMKQVLPHTDLLLLVTDPNKYGDQVFYELCASTRQAIQNKYIVFNKTDQIEAAYGDQAGTVQASLLEDLDRKLKATLNDDPPLTFAVSASRAFDDKRRSAAPPEAFQALEDTLEALRDEKLRQRIKRTNLDAAWDHLKGEILSALASTRYVDKTDAFQEAMEGAERELTQSGRDLVAACFTPDLYHRLKRYLAGRVIQGWSFTARMVARFSRLTYTGPMPDSGLIMEKLNVFGRRITRKVQKLKHHQAADWPSAPPSAPTAAQGDGAGSSAVTKHAEVSKRAEISWDLRGQIDGLSSQSKRKHFFWAVLLGLAVILFFAARPGLVTLLDNLKGEATASTLLKDFSLAFARQLLTYLQPVLLLSWCLFLAGFYAGAIILSLLRIESRTGRKLIQLSRSLQEQIETTVKGQLTAMAAQNEDVRQRGDNLKAWFR